MVALGAHDAAGDGRATARARQRALSAAGVPASNQQAWCPSRACGGVPCGFSRLLQLAECIPAAADHVASRRPLRCARFNTIAAPAWALHAPSLLPLLKQQHRHPSGASSSLVRSLGQFKLTLQRTPLPRSSCTAGKQVRSANWLWEPRW